ncbi:Acyl-CoA reductase [Gordonia malaquae]|uniref:aldehyde dehydrogenase (NAD(+)) n=1 Tax=Gordonia malaquae NBRC 108250 TaxID=1223542 RepID=M3UYQ7_GORML|nr:aldehyde dehydrogenase family protein [Gordonia malaquae]GAC81047.1 putative aldehyde dehydrogenase [Gordonia malaquae NBRC 108250]SEB74600.1 Acyl-CoA reductase [Gordonia malaquae]
MTATTTVALWQRDAALIDGAWRTVAETVDVHAPATGATIGTSASSTAIDVDDAVAAARAALPAWSTASPEARADVLDALVAELRNRRDDLVAATVAEVGAPVAVAREAHIDLGIEIMADFAGLARTFEWQTTIGNSRVLRRAAGVVAAITPWNYPFYQLVAKAGAALAAGCPIVVKPAELTPLSTYLFADAAVAAGVPAGVFSLVPGAGRVVGSALAEHPGVDVVSFTGSTGVGKTIAVAAAQNIKRACLELGGKSASVILDDADLDEAVRTSVAAGLLNSGQTCSAWSRLLVPRSRYEDALTIAADAVAAMRVGDPTDESTDLGPVISAAQRTSIVSAIDGALARGARLVCGGPDPLPEFPGGHFVAPTVLADLQADDPAVRDEIFGPVIVVLPHDGDDHAVQLANDSEYGLAGAVWSGDTDRAIAVASRIDTGQVDVNGAPFNPRAPFGGWKASGLGRELGPVGLEEFTEITSIQL